MADGSPLSPSVSVGVVTLPEIEPNDGPPEIVASLRADQVVPRADFAGSGIDVKNDTHGSTTLKVKVELANAEAECQPPTVTVRW